ncbi:MAG: TIGR03089 family protein [Propionibacteriales bacterium]|nr:TIGR03089 family protein [Propionibacteriales bacterium]
MTTTTVPDLMSSMLDKDPARPFVTFYDGATGERTELSVKSFENWVAKTANLLQNELDAGPDTHVALWLPTHWLSAVWMCAGAACGSVVSGYPDTARITKADVIVCGPETLDTAAAATAARVVALSLDPMVRGFVGQLPDGVLDYGPEVLSQDDVFVPSRPPDSETPLVHDGEFAHPQGELLGEARHQAGRLGIQQAGRLLTHLNPASLVGFVIGVLAPMVSDGSVVLVRNGYEAMIDELARQERVGTRLWQPG